MKKIIAFSIFTLLLTNYCVADNLPLSDVIKEAREKALTQKTSEQKTKIDELYKTNSQDSKQDVKNTVTKTLDNFRNIN